MLLALLLLPGLLIRAAVPAGFMPAIGQGTALTMAMCSGQATQSVVVHPGSDPRPAHPDQRSPQHHEAPCVFVAMSCAALSTAITSGGTDTACLPAARWIALTVLSGL